MQLSVRKDVLLNILKVRPVMGLIQFSVLMPCYHKRPLVSRQVLKSPLGNGLSNHDLDFKEPIGEHFNLGNHKGEDITVWVIDHNMSWTDAERNSKGRSWMHRLKSFRPDDMKKQIDLIIMIVS